MILSLALIITNITIIYSVYSLKKRIKLNYDECEATMRELTENSLKEFIKEIKRHEKEFHSDNKSPFDPRHTPSYDAPTHNILEEFEKSEQRKKDEKGEKISRALRAHHAKKNYERDKAAFLKIKQKKAKAAEKARLYRAKKSAEKEEAALERQPAFEPYRAFTREGEESIQ